MAADWGIANTVWVSTVEITIPKWFCDLNAEARHGTIFVQNERIVGRKRMDYSSTNTPHSPFWVPMDLYLRTPQECPWSVPENRVSGGVSHGVSLECPKSQKVSRGTVSPKCPGHVLDTLGTSPAHFLDTPWDTPSDIPCLINSRTLRGHSLGPSGPKDFCRWPGSSHRSWPVLLINTCIILPSFPLVSRFIFAIPASFIAAPLTSSAPLTNQCPEAQTFVPKGAGDGSLIFSSAGIHGKCTLNKNHAPIGLRNPCAPNRLASPQNRKVGQN